MFCFMYVQTKKLNEKKLNISQIHFSTKIKFYYNSINMSVQENNRRKKFYSLELKSKVILYWRSLQTKQNIKDKSINLMEKMFDVDRRIISGWLKLNLQS